MRKNAIRKVNQKLKSFMKQVDFHQQRKPRFASSDYCSKALFLAKVKKVIYQREIAEKLSDSYLERGSKIDL